VAAIGNRYGSGAGARGEPDGRARWLRGQKGETPAGERGFLVVPLAVPLAGLDCCRVDLNRRDDRHPGMKLRIVDSRRNPQKYVDRFP
jgi:hypothetical protein